MAFFYEGFSGKVNGEHKAKRCTTPNVGVSITFKLDQNSVSFAIDDVSQPGSWLIPELFYIFVDIYHPGSYAEILAVK